MNLKEAFRFQNRLTAMMDEAEGILGRDQNTTRVQNTYLRKKVMAEAETAIEQASTPYSEQITDVAVFRMYLLAERETLSAAIHKAKVGLALSAGLDGEVAVLLRHMAGLRGES